MPCWPDPESFITYQALAPASTLLPFYGGHAQRAGISGPCGGRGWCWKTSTDAGLWVLGAEWDYFQLEEIRKADKMTSRFLLTLSSDTRAHAKITSRF